MDVTDVVTFITGDATTALTSIAVAGLVLAVTIKYFRRARGAA